MFGEPAAPKETQHIRNQDQEKNAPDDVLKLPPLSLEFEIFSNGDRVIHLWD